jgi:hypothetical protein
VIEFLTSDQIIAAIPAFGHAFEIKSNWPVLEHALHRHGILDLPTSVACVATVCVETGCFSPVKERGGPAYLTKLYEGRADLGNTEPGDGALFRGRGFIQITGRSNYRHYGQRLNVDIEEIPDRALEPGIAADILALYFKDHNIQELAAITAWEAVRRKVNGGLNGWADFIHYIQELSQTPRTLLA